MEDKKKIAYFSVQNEFQIETSVLFWGNSIFVNWNFSNFKNFIKSILLFTPNIVTNYLSKQEDKSILQKV